MFDGHEDAWLPTRSATGEASDSELAIAIGKAGVGLSGTLDVPLPLVDASRVGVLGARDAAEIAAAGETSVRDDVAMFMDDREVADMGGEAAARAAWMRSGTSTSGSTSISTSWRRTSSALRTTCSRADSRGRSWTPPSFRRSRTIVVVGRASRSTTRSPTPATEQPRASWTSSRGRCGRPLRSNASRPAASASCALLGPDAVRGFSRKSERVARRNGYLHPHGRATAT